MGRSGGASAARREGKTKEMDGPLEEGPFDRSCIWAAWSVCRKIGRRLVTTPEMGWMGVVLMTFGLGNLVAESECVRRGTPISSWIPTVPSCKYNPRRDECFRLVGVGGTVAAASV